VDYVTVTAEELGHLREGLQIIETLNNYADDRQKIYFYGLTTDTSLLDSVKEAVSYWAEEEVAEQDVNVAQAVLIFEISADILYYLTGSGLTVRDGEAIYDSGSSEGPRQVWLKNRNNRSGFKASIGQFSTMALSRDDMSGEDFLAQYGTKTAPQPQEVQRTEPAQQPQEPQPVAPAAVTPGREGVAPAKKSSLNFDVDTWLN